MPSGLDDAGNALVLQRRRREGGLLREERLSAVLLSCVYTSVGGRLRGLTTRLTERLGRLREQDKVLMLGRQIEVL